MKYLLTFLIFIFPLSSCTVNKVQDTTYNNSTTLPRSVYYSYADYKSGKYQIFRMERDGITTTQLTYDPDGIWRFDVSPIDGKILYFIKNALYHTDKEGKNASLVSNYSESAIWSPDGNIIAFWNGNLNFFSTDKNEIIKTIAIPEKKDALYNDMKYSPDGQNIALYLSRTSFGILNLRTENLSILIQSGNDTKPPFASSFTWSQNSEFLYLWESVDAGGANGVTYHGLWRFELSGNGSSLFQKNVSGGLSSEVTAAPWQDKKGNLYYLLRKDSYAVSESSFVLVKSEINTNINRIIIRSEELIIYCNQPRPKWASDGSGLLIAQGKSCKNDNLIFVPINPNKIIHILIHDAKGLYDMSWGP